jgi:preprotein translocase SecE subunit
MGVFFQELLSVGIYKRSQGRITRQVTFAALAVVIVIGLLRLSQTLEGLDPIVPERPAIVSCTAPNGVVKTAGTITVAGFETNKRDDQKSESISVAADESLVKLADDINAKKEKTQVRAEVVKGELLISHVIKGSQYAISVKAIPNTLLDIQGLNNDGVAVGRDNLNLGLRFLIPSLLMIVLIWMAYRIVNMPNFADFLIAVEAEINKVSWPTRGELFRASMVVLVCIILLALILYAYDIIWRLFFSKILHIM